MSARNDTGERIRVVARAGLGMMGVPYLGDMIPVGVPTVSALRQ